jgi:hypothetical protein
MLEKSAPKAALGAVGVNDEDIDVLVVDDHPGVRFAIEALIARTPGLRVVGSVSTGRGDRRRCPTATTQAPAPTTTPAPSGGIPQGATAGDADGDNHGGPSGDGNV